MPLADKLPEGSVESARQGATMLNAWAETGEGQNFLAHALVQLARDGWLRPRPGNGFEPITDETAPQLPAGSF